jgi:integrase
MKINITRKTKELEQEVFFKLFDEFIHNSSTGIRRKKDGSRLSEGTVGNYVTVKNSIQEFCKKKNFKIRLFVDCNLTPKEREKAFKYWLKFYDRYTSYLYYDRNDFDNVVGFYIKNLKVFMNYLIAEKHLMIGQYHKQFYCEKQEIPVIALSTAQLNYLIYDKTFDQSLSGKLKVVRDIFVFGCSVALRVSDLLAVADKNIEKRSNRYYLKVKSQKTSTYTSVLLPDYAVEIVKRYSKKKNKTHKTLFPFISISYFNIQLKVMAQNIPDNQEIKKIREQRGKQVVIYKCPEKKIHYTLADHITTHTMRRTAITNMLSLGMPKNVVRKISGHAPNSKEFFRYVEFAQSTLDVETEKYHEKMKELAEKSRIG